MGEKFNLCILSSLEKGVLPLKIKSKADNNVFLSLFQIWNHTNHLNCSLINIRYVPCHSCLETDNFIQDLAVGLHRSRHFHLHPLKDFVWFWQQFFHLTHSQLYQGLVYFKGGFFSESAICFSDLQISKKNIPKNYPELEI